MKLLSKELLQSVEESVRICDRFLAKAHQNPDAVAIQTGAQRLTYRQLDQASWSLSRQIEGALGPADAEAIVAIYGKRSPQVILALLACARANVTFAVLDAAYPAERIQTMLRVMQPTLALGVDTEHAALMEVLGTQLPPSRVWPVDATAWEHSFAESPLAEVPPRRPVPSTAYLLFTSGTTGVPKCIQTSHRPLGHFVDWYIRTFHVAPGSRFSMLSGLGHDPILRDIFVPLSAGGEIHIPAQADITNPPKLFNWFQSTGVAYAHATPQLLKLLCAGAGPGQTLPRLTHVFSGGDALKMSHVEALRKISPTCQPVNFYGTTETPQAVACHRLQADEVKDPIPVGHAIDGVTLHVLSDDFHPVPAGKEGQLAIESDHLSNGYLGDDTLTRGRYIRLPHRSNMPRVYLTGDRAVQRPDGALVLKGRIDDQIKIRGFRVELGDIVCALESECDICSAVVLPKLQANGEHALVAYLVTSLPWDDAAQRRLKTALARKVPNHMVPAHYVVLDALPLLPNGKLDRSRLPAIDAPAASGERIEVLQHPVGQALTEAWKRILGLPHLSPTRSFVDLGGDSLSFIQASLAIEKVLGWVPDGWETMPLEKVAQHPVRRSQRGSQVGVPIVLRALAIFLVVLGHATPVHFIGTSLLFVISGMSFGKFFRHKLLETGDPRPVINFILKFGIPACLWQILAVLTGARALWLPDLFLMNTYIQDSAHPHFTLWYLDVLTANLLIMSVVYILYGKFLKGTKSAVPRFSIDVMLVLIGLLISFLQVGNAWWDGKLGEDSVAPFKWFWMLALGVLIAHAQTLKEKLAVTVLLGAIGVATLSEIPKISSSFAQIDGFFLIAVPALVWLNQIYIPRWARRVVVTMASASLFIYIVNHTVIQKTRSILNFEGSWPIEMLLAIVIGIACSSIWKKAELLLMRMRDDRKNMKLLNVSKSH